MSLLEADVELGVVKALPRAREGEGARRGRRGRRPRAGEADRQVTRRATTSSRSATTSSSSFMGPATPPLDVRRRRAADRHHDGRPAGLRKDDDRARKLARWLQKQGKKPLLVAADMQRPAAVEQLKILGEQLGIPVFNVAGRDAARDLRAGARARREAAASTTSSSTTPPAASRSTSRSWRSSRDIKAAVAPENILLVVDAMIGQDAVKTAEGLPRPPRPDRRRAHEARRRRARRRGAQREGGHRRGRSRSPAWARRSTSSRSSAPTAWPAASSAWATSSA